MLHILQLSIQEGLQVRLQPHELYIPTNVSEIHSNFQVEKKCHVWSDFISFYQVAGTSGVWTIQRFGIMVDHENLTPTTIQVLQNSWKNFFFWVSIFIHHCTFTCLVIFEIYIRVIWGRDLSAQNDK